jgi:hypothetical protein
MSDNPRLSAGVEVTALLRRAEALGGFGTVLRKGDPERGSIVLAVTERGEHRGLLERRLRPDWTYGWASIGPESGDSGAVTQHLARIRKQDPDCWILELDVPLSKRFIAETIAEG